MWSPMNPGLVQAIAEDHLRHARHEGARRRLLAEVEEAPSRRSWRITLHRTRPVPLNTA